MTILVIADDEELMKKLPDVEAEVLVSCGDLPEPTIRLAAQRCRCKVILAVKGNHDNSAPFEPPIIDLHLRSYTFRGVNFGGFCGAWKYKPRGNYLFQQSEVESALSTFPSVDVFVSHNSPRMIHDRDDEVHIGFNAFNSYISRARPRWLLHGHQHLNIESSVGATRVVGIYGHRFIVIPD
ncbi:metallophosphoesterase family protein [Verrucomicrobiota bacterium sgz303538]